MLCLLAGGTVGVVDGRRGHVRDTLDTWVRLLDHIRSTASVVPRRRTRSHVGRLRCVSALRLTRVTECYTVADGR